MSEEDPLNSILSPVMQSILSAPPMRSPVAVGIEQLVDNAEQNTAEAFHKRLATWIQAFNESLDPEHEVGVRLVSFGQNLEFHLTGIGHSNPSLLVFHGVTADGHPVKLIQHVTQVSVLLMQLPRLDPSKPRIGFDLSPGDADRA